MDVFHYVADQLKDESLFDSPPLEPFTESGSIYNDFDRCHQDLLDTDSEQLFCYSQTTNYFDETGSFQDETLVQEAVDHAIMQEGLYADVNFNLQWDTPLFDNFGNCNAIDYMEKVYQLSTDHEAWHELTFTKECIEMFERRLRTTWEGPDTVYDAWLLRKGCERPCFDYNTFHLRHPDCADLLNDQHVIRKRRKTEGREGDIDVEKMDEEAEKMDEEAEKINGDEENGSRDEENGSRDEENGSGDEENGRGDEENGRGDEENGRGDEEKVDRKGENHDGEDQKKSTGEGEGDVDFERESDDELYLVL